MRKTLQKQFTNIIYSTKNYEMFTFTYDRTTQKALKALEKSVREDNKLVMHPIFVDEDFKILDGHHRFFVAKKLGVELFYMVTEMTIGEIISQNTVINRWKRIDSLKLLAQVENINAQELIKIYEHYNEKWFFLLEYFCYSKSFYGKEIVLLPLAERENLFILIDSIYEIVGDFYMGRTFIISVIQVSKIENFNMNIFKNRLRSYMTKLKRYANMSDQIKNLIEVYNYHTLEKHRIFYRGKY